MRDEGTTKTVGSTVSAPSSISSPVHSNGAKTNKEDKEEGDKEKKGKDGQSPWKQGHLKLDWAHVGPDAVAGAAFLAQQGSSRKQEVEDVTKKLSSIKAIARRTSRAVGGEEKEWPWLAEDVCVAACLCAQSTRVRAGREEEEEGCCKRQKIS